MLKRQSLSKKQVPHKTRARHARPYNVAKSSRALYRCPRRGAHGAPVIGICTKFRICSPSEKEIKMGRETKTAQKMSRIKGYNRRLMHFIEKTVFALWTVLYYHGSIKSARTSGRFLWKFCLVERFTSRCPSRELYQGNLSRRRKTGLGIKGG